MAMDHQAEEEYKNALLSTQRLIEEQPEYLEFLASPSIPKAERIQAIEEAFSKNFPEPVVSFLQILSENGLIRHFPEIVAAYMKKYKAANRIRTVQIISAAALDQSEKDTLVQKLEKKTGCTVQPEFFQDESILGGLVIKIGDQVLDGSLKNRLAQMKEVMLK